MKKFNIYSGRDYIKQIQARNYRNAQAAADNLGSWYKYPGPMIAIPDDPRVKPNDRHTQPTLIAQHTKGKVIE